MDDSASTTNGDSATWSVDLSWPSPSSYSSFDNELENPGFDDIYIRNGVSCNHASSDALLAYELNKLSFKERDQINDDIHGVGKESPTNETPELLKEALQQLSVELEHIDNKPAYNASQTFTNTYVNTDNFRLIFLRSEFLDAKKAAKRIVGYLDTIRWCFGDEVLMRDIRLSDFTGESAKYLQFGCQQLLPGRDRSGRRIVGNFICDMPATARDRIRTALYMLMTVARDNIDVQKRGLVGLFWARELKFDDIKVRSIVHARIIPVMPVHFRSIHTCLPTISSPIVEMVKSMHIYVVGPKLRQRMRIHQGSAIECLYTLQTFGIQSHQIPINTNTGKIKPQSHLRWLDFQRTREKMIVKDKEFHGIECPEQNDILLGRGWPTMSHPGNAIFRNLIEVRSEAYNTAESKRDKTIIAWSIVSELKEAGSRFLREKSGWWMEVSDEVARAKVSVGFRDIRKAKMKSAKLAEKTACRTSMIDSNFDEIRDTVQSVRSSSEASAATPNKTKSDRADSAILCATPVRGATEKDSKDTISIEDGGTVAFINTDRRKRMRHCRCGDARL